MVLGQKNRSIECGDVPDLIGVIGTGDEQEDPGEGVFSGVWDLSRL